MIVRLWRGMDGWQLTPTDMRELIRSTIFPDILDRRDRRLVSVSGLSIAAQAR